MKEYKKSRINMTIKITLSVIIPFLVFASVSVIIRKYINMELMIIYLFSILLLYPLIVYIFFNKYIYYAYHHFIKIEEISFDCNNMYVAGSLVNKNIKYAAIERIELFSPPISIGSVALRIKIKNEDSPIDIDNKYVNYIELWKNICDNCKKANPNVFIDPKILEKIGKE